MSRWVNKNLNPRGKHVGDCVVRSVAKACRKTWDEAYTALTVQGFADKDLPSSNLVWGNYLKSEGFKRYAVPDTCPDCYTVEQFCEEHPAGTYVLALQSHVVVAVDGQYWDSWDSGQEPLIYYWERNEE